jgi:ribosomal protein S18 acetylase RimI-like enzyme
MEIRAFAESDRAAVVGLWREVFGEMPAHNDPDRDIDRKMKVNPELFLVAVENGAVIGTAMGGYDGHRGWVNRVAVDPGHRRKGVGRALMREVEERLRRLGCPKLNLQVYATNTQVVKFYERLGYAVEKRISMGKRL